MIETYQPPIQENNQQVTYNGAFIGVAGNFNKSNQIQKELIQSEIVISQPLSEESSNSDYTKNRKSYMSKLGFINNGVDLKIGQSFLSNGMPNLDVNKNVQLKTATLVIGSQKEDSFPMVMEESKESYLISRSLPNEDSTSLYSIKYRTTQELNIHDDTTVNYKLDEHKSDKEQLSNEGQYDISGYQNNLINQEVVYESFVLPDCDGYSLQFIQKSLTNDKIRRKFLSKLTYQKIWLTPNEKPKQHETAIFFDWDDTLLCTSFINPSGYYQDQELPPAIQAHLMQLEQLSSRILELAVKCGKTFIITNAAEGWVEFSARKFMPSVVPYLDKITIISARTKYETHFPGDVTQWKLHAFLETQENIDVAMITNILALGDSMMEINAAHHLALRFQRALIKTVKFREFPRPNELVKQLQLVIQKFDEIINSPKNLTIRLEKKPN